MGPLFCLRIGLANILTNHPQTEHLDSADENNDAHVGGPSLYIIAKHQLFHNNKHNGQKRKPGAQHSHPGGSQPRKRLATPG